MKERATGFGSGKVILLGEHAVVHGAPAIAVGLARGVTTVARRSREDLILIDSRSGVAAPDLRREEPLSRAFAEALSSYHGRPPLRLDISVDLPPGAGLGCSAAIGVSVFDAIDRVLGIERSRADLGDKAFAWEKIFHGTPSGIDNAIAALGGLIRFEHARGASALQSCSPLHLVIAHSGQHANTKEMVAKVAHRLRHKPRKTRELFGEVSRLVDEAERSLLRGDVRALGEQLDRNHAILRALGVSTPGLEALRDDAKSAGALGAKVTGSGGGGCIVALAEDARHAGFVADSLWGNAFITEVARAA